MTRNLGYLFESVSNSPQQVLIVLLFVAAFGLLIWSKAKELIRLRREERTGSISAHLHEVRDRGIGLNATQNTYDADADRPVPEVGRGVESRTGIWP